MTRVAKKYIDEMVAYFTSYVESTGDEWEHYMCVDFTRAQQRAGARTTGNFTKVLIEHGVSCNGSLDYKPPELDYRVSVNRNFRSLPPSRAKNEIRLNFLLLLQASGLH